jgi:hypothetical protein
VLPVDKGKANVILLPREREIIMRCWVTTAVLSCYRRTARYRNISQFRGKSLVSADSVSIRTY